ncbi:Circadian clock-controlled protein daywake [Pseudolycoriella hygida]|uniref:Circadian clock-controlled protein daywake n=1 Tax=Pseudolycoriella hygida TaxID=35572 RepID=A0A9Q0RV32_9DIPT|nr:Circadian clock-controlled protein daywake [Pseudolycoriella hygida]
MMCGKVILLCLATIFTVAYGLDGLPEYIHICPKNERATQCIIDNVERLRPYVHSGIPELGVPGIEPLYLGDLLVSERTNNNGVTITAKNIKAFGPSQFKVKKLNIVQWGEEYHFELFIPHIYVEGTYNIDGQILLFPIKGSGKFVGNFTSATGSVKCFLSKHSEDDIVQIQKFDIKIKMGKGSIKLKDLFNGDKVLGEAINDVINDNFEILSKDIVPLVEKALQRTFKKIGNQISRYTYAELFPMT